MILSGREIERHMGKDIIIEPFDQKRLNPNSYNLLYIVNCGCTKIACWI